MTVVEADRSPSLVETRLGGRFRLDERINVGDQISGTCGASWEAGGLSLWKATDELLGRPVTIYLLPAGRPVSPDLVAAVLAAAKVSDPRLATIYDTDLSADRPYIVSEWATGMHLEDLVLSGLPTPALAAAMIADAADALAVAHQAGRPHLRLTPRSLRWDSTGLKITGLGLDAALCGSRPDEDPMLADTRALARMLYALLTGCWPGEEATALPPAPRYKGRVCTPRQVRAGVPALLDAITYQALRGHAPDAPTRPLTPAALARALHGVRRPSLRLVDPPELAGTELAGTGLAGTGLAGTGLAGTGLAESADGLDPIRRPGHAAWPWAERVQALPRESVSRRRARHARARGGLLHHTTLLRSAV